MSKIGKIIGALLGMTMFVGTSFVWFGLLLGVLVGHFFDRGLNSDFRFVTNNHQAIQEVFFRSTFRVLGYVAKADGHVSRAEINVAESLMTRMRITGAMRQQAIQFFGEGKGTDFDLEQCLAEFNQYCGGQRLLVRLFLEIQVQLVLADGQVQEQEMRLLSQIALKLNFNAAQLERLIRFSAYSQRFSGQAAGWEQKNDLQSQLNEAYSTLGLEASASEQEIKRAYRKLMAQHHPDKLVAKGLPEEMMTVAKEKTQAIQSAYDFILKNKKS